MKYIKKRTKVFIVSIIILIIFLGFLEYRSYLNLKNNYHKSLINEYRLREEAILDSYQKSSKLLFNTHFNTEEIKNLIYKANYADKLKRDELRTKLSDEYQDIYNEMKKYEFRQLHFHLEDKITSFLRFHKVDKYGDSLIGIRSTLEAAHKNKKEITGFEEGRIFNGFRYVYPYFYKDEFVGTVEISVSYSSILKIVNQSYNQKGFFIIKEDVVKSKIFDDEIDNYKVAKFNKNFLYDNEIYNDFLENLQNKNILTEINNKLSEEFNDKSKDFVIGLNDKTYNAIVGLNVKNYEDKSVGYLIFLNPNKSKFTGKRDLKMKLFYLFIILIVSLIYLSGFYKKQSKLNQSLITDQLTKAYNRTFINQNYKKIVNKNENTTLLIFDIDDFKDINDKFGHNEGDYVLKEMTALINQNIRESDFLIRWGGEEFIILLEIDKEKGIKKAEDIRKLIENHNFNENYNITISIGISKYSDSDLLDDLVNRADKRLYKAKENGKNQVVYD
ncbi:MAG: GGDEF domain-containing protein [Bacillota bacterium]